MSFFHRPDNGDIAAKDLNSHENTRKALNLNLNLWREGHYTPDGKLELRVIDIDKITQQECSERFQNRFPSFVSFFSWCLQETNQTDVFGGSLDLNSLTSAKGLVLPKRIGGWLYLNSLTSAEQEKIRKEYGK